MTRGQCFNVSVAGGIAYLCAASGEIQIVDVSDPSAPMTIGGVEVMGLPSGIDAVGGFVYQADGPFGITVISGQCIDFTSTPAEDGSAAQATGARLGQNFPNPFNPKTAIRFRLADAQTVILSVHDVSGRLLDTLIDAKHFSAGSHETTWLGRDGEGRDGEGRAVGSGVYFFRLKTASGVESRRAVLI